MARAKPQLWRLDGKEQGEALSFILLWIEEDCEMATRADFDAVKSALVSAIQAAAGRFGGGSGPVVTDQDIADLKTDVDKINALGSGGKTELKLSISPDPISASAQATVTLTAPTAQTSDQVWNIAFTPNVLVAPAAVTWPAGQASFSFEITARNPSVDTFCTVTASFGAQTVSGNCTVLHV